MAKLTYNEQLQHPNWQRLRLEALQEARWECQNCGDKETTLHVHHKRYVRARMAWEYELDDLLVLCGSCHSKEHGARRLLDEIIADVGPGGLDIIIGIAVGYLDAVCDLNPDIAQRARVDREMFYEFGLAAAALESRGIEAWRAPVRAVVSSARPVTPTLQLAVRDWDEKEKK